MVFGFGSAFALNNTLVADYPPILVAGIRAFIATLVTGIFTLLCGFRAPADMRSLAIYLLMGVMGGLTTALPFAAIAWGQLHIPSSLGSVLLATIPLFTLLVGLPFVPERSFRPAQLAGTLIGLAGVAISTGAPAVGGDWPGISITLLAALSYALGGLLAQRLRRFESQVLATIQLACGTVLLFPFAIYGAEFPPLDERQFVALAVLGIACTAAPMLAVFALIRRVGAMSASTATLFIPVVAVSIGTVGLGESFSLSLLAGLIGVILGAYMIARSEAGIDTPKMVRSAL